MNNRYIQRTKENGHKPSTIAEKRYRRHSIDLLHSWHEKIEVWVLEQTGIELLPALHHQALRVVS